MKKIRQAASAFQFLTILPVPVRTDAADMTGSMVWYPLVGAVVGVATGYALEGFRLIFPMSVASALAIAVYLALTRGFHMDGYMDALDGFLSHRGPERILAIMKDPHAGSFAIMGAGIWFLVLHPGYGGLSSFDIIVTHMSGRTAILCLPLFFTYPRCSGTGKFFVDHVVGRTAAGALGLWCLIAGVLIVLPQSPLHQRIITALTTLGVSLATALAAGWWSKRKIGGITGDVLGFAIESAHMASVLVLLTGRRF